jgi:hypothetical protein
MFQGGRIYYVVSDIVFHTLSSTLQEEVGQDVYMCIYIYI